jgi:hypothetical protein
MPFQQFLVHILSTYMISAEQQLWKDMEAFFVSLVLISLQLYADIKENCEKPRRV